MDRSRDASIRGFRDINDGSSLENEDEASGEAELIEEEEDDDSVSEFIGPLPQSAEATILLPPHVEGATETTSLLKHKINWSAFKIATGVASLGIAMGLTCLSAGGLLLSIYGVVHRLQIRENTNLPVTAILARQSQLDSTGLSTGIKAVSLAISTGIATITVMFLGGPSTNFTFTLALAGANMVIQEVLGHYGTNTHHNLAARANTLFETVGHTIEEKMLLRFFRRALETASPSRYPAPREPREAVLRGELQKNGAKWVSGAFGLLLTLALAPVYGGMDAGVIGLSTYASIDWAICGYLHMMRRAMVVETEERLASSGEANPEVMATEIVMRSAFLGTHLGDFLANTNVIGSRLLDVAKYVPLGLLAAALPGSARNIVLSIVGTSAAAAAVDLGYAVGAIGNGNIRPEDVNNNVSDNSPVRKVFRTLVYGVFILLCTVLAPYFAVIGTVGTSSIVDLTFAIGGLAWMAVTLTLTYFNLNRIDNAVLGVIPCVANSDSCQIFMSNSEGRTAAERRTAIEANGLIENLRTQIEQRQARAIGQDSMPLISQPGARVDLNLDNIGNVRLEVVSRDANGMLRCTVSEPPQDPATPGHIREILIDSQHDGNLRIQYNNGTSVELIGGVVHQPVVVQPRIIELSSSRSLSTIVSISGSYSIDMNSGAESTTSLLEGRQHRIEEVVSSSSSSSSQSHTVINIVDIGRIASTLRRSSSVILTPVPQDSSESTSFVSEESGTTYHTASEEISNRSDFGASDQSDQNASSTDSTSATDTAIQYAPQTANNLSADSSTSKNHKLEVILPETLELFIKNYKYDFEKEDELFLPFEYETDETRWQNGEEDDNKEYEKYDIEGNYIMRPNDIKKQTRLEEESGAYRYNKTIYPEKEYFDPERQDITKSGWFNYGNDFIVPMAGVVMFAFQQHTISHF